MKPLNFLFYILFITVLACSSDKEASKATCTDGIKNGDETSIDCGGSCGNCQTGTNTNKGYDASKTHPGYSLVWSDEFDGDTLDSTKWGFHVGTGCPNLCGWGNNEKQYFTNRIDNTYLENGNLIIKAKSEEINDKEYSSARIHTDNNFEFKYGRVDIRARMPSVPGTWAALFMMNKNYTLEDPTAYWPSGGEIDIMEYIGENHNDILGTSHFGADVTNHRFNSIHFGALNNQGFDEVYYVFSIIWEENKITWLVNDLKYNEITPELTSNNGQPYPFNDEFYFVLALSVGGNLTNISPIPENFPAYLIVDYIRVYQKDM